MSMPQSVAHLAAPSLVIMPPVPRQEGGVAGAFHQFFINLVDGLDQSGIFIKDRIIII